MGKGNEGKGIAGFVLSIIGLVLAIIPFISLALSIMGIVYSSKQDKIKKTGLATAGLVIGIIGVVINGLVALVFLLVILLIPFA